MLELLTRHRPRTGDMQTRLGRYLFHYLHRYLEQLRIINFQKTVFRYFYSHRDWLYFLVNFHTHGCLAIVTWILCAVINRLFRCKYFYDAFLIDVTTNDRMDKVSSAGYAYGYLGSCIPFIIFIIFQATGILPISDVALVNIGFVMTALWWLFSRFPCGRTCIKFTIFQR